MRIRQLQLVVAPADLAGFLGRFLKPDRVSNLVIGTGEGTLRVNCDYKLGFFPVPVDLTLRVAAVRPDLLVLAVQAPGMILDTLGTAIRNSRIEALGWEQGHFYVKVDRLGPLLRGTQFQLRSAAFTPEGVALGVSELVLPLG